MLDHVNWYLVELDRRLRGKRSCHAAADFIRETRSHLNERVEELVAMGMEPGAAAKAAISDFGDPSSVALGFWRRPGVPKWVVYGGVGLSALCTWMAIPGMAAMSNGVIGAVDPRLASSLFPVPALGLAICLILSWRTRKWLAVPLSLFAVISTLLATAFLANNTAKIETTSGARWLYLPAQQEQLQVRADFVQRLDTMQKKVQAWRDVRAKNTQRPAGAERLASEEKLLNALATGERGEPIGPNLSRHDWRYNGPEDLRFLLEHTPIWETPPMSLGPKNSPLYTMSHWPEQKVAKKLWQQNGDGYAAALKSARVLVQQDMGAIKYPHRTAMAERWRYLMAPPMASAGVWCVMALIANGILIALSNTVGQLRRRAWRRQVG